MHALDVDEANDFGELAGHEVGELAQHAISCPDARRTQRDRDLGEVALHRPS